MKISMAKKKTAAQLEREISASLARSTKGPRRFGGWYVPGVTPGTYSAHHEVEGSFPRTKFQARKATDPKRASLGPGPRTESEKQIHPEMFAVMDRDGKILGRSYSVKGAMALAPYDKSYAVVRGEYTSDGTNHGVGRGRMVAVREFTPNAGFRWHMEPYAGGL